MKTLILSLVLSACASTVPTSTCSQEAPAYCYWQNESKRSVCCPEDLPHACIGTNICAISEDWCPHGSVLCSSKMD